MSNPPAPQPESFDSSTVVYREGEQPRQTAEKRKIKYRTEYERVFERACREKLVQLVRTKLKETIKRPKYQKTQNQEQRTKVEQSAFKVFKRDLNKRKRIPPGTIQLAFEFIREIVPGYTTLMMTKQKDIWKDTAKTVQKVWDKELENMKQEVNPEQDQARKRKARRKDDEAPRKKTRTDDDNDDNNSDNDEYSGVGSSRDESSTSVSDGGGEDSDSEAQRILSLLD